MTQCTVSLDRDSSRKNLTVLIAIDIALNQLSFCYETVSFPLQITTHCAEVLGPLKRTRCTVHLDKDIFTPLIKQKTLLSP